MNMKLIIIFMLFLAFTSTLSVSSITNSCIRVSMCARAETDSQVHNIDTGLSYASIQEAINANETLHGHTLQVDSGIYHEHLTINKSVSLIGQNKLDTILDGDGNQTIIKVTANNVTIAGFTLQNTTTGYSAIRIEDSEDNNITNNVIKNTYYGIHLYNSRRNTVIHNQAVDNTYSGIYLYFSHENSVSYCNFSKNINAGIFTFNSTNNLFHGNSISSHKYGISLTDSDNNHIYGNTISTAELGVRMSNSHNNLIFWNNVSRSQSGIQIGNSNNNTISNNTFSSNSKNGMLIESSNNNVLQNNIVQNNEDSGVRLRFSSSNTLLNNNVSNNQYGIHIANSDNCIINGNKAFNNSYGIALSTSLDNSFWYNNIQEGQRGIHFDHSSNNTIINNNFVNNTKPLSSISSANYLDNGVEGNYWSNYNGTDANQDAVGDTAHILAENNTDNHPLMGEFFRFVILHEKEIYPVSVISNSTISNLQFDETIQIISFKVTGLGTEGFCRVRIPKTLISISHVIVVDGKRVNATLLPISNATHKILYFAYPLPSHQVTIVSGPYYDLLQKYNSLLAEYHNLNSTYNELLAHTHDYDVLFANYTQLQADYDVLFANYTQLQANFTQLQNNLENLDRMYSQLNNTRNLLYGLTVAIVGIAAVLLSINIRFHRRISEQEKIINAYNPLEIARIHFREDVENRGVKIEKFEKKHGVKIRPHNTLEDVLNDLEKRTRKDS